MTGGNVAVHDDACHTTLVAMVTVVINNRHILLMQPVTLFHSL